MLLREQTIRFTVIILTMSFSACLRPFATLRVTLGAVKAFGVAGGSRRGYGRAPSKALCLRPSSLLSPPKNSFFFAFNDFRVLFVFLILRETRFSVLFFGISELSMLFFNACSRYYLRHKDFLEGDRFKPSRCFFSQLFVVNNLFELQLFNEDF